jgi:pimeloyl-ACP methyl ester carboxylesterase
MKEKIVKKNGIRLFTESFGCEKDPAILLIAGATVSMLYWDAEFCQKLSEKGFFVIRYDNRDVGKSTNYEPGSTPYDIVDLTHDAISILDGYKIVKANFVGISLGGLISQIASIKYADRVSSITLISSGPWGDSDPTIPEMDTRILDFHGKAETVDWSAIDSGSLVVMVNMVSSLVVMVNMVSTFISNDYPWSIAGVAGCLMPLSIAICLVSLGNKGKCSRIPNTSKPKLAPTLYSAYFLKILVAMCPPKPKVLLIA